MAFKDIALFAFSTVQDEAALAIAERVSPEANPHIAVDLLQIEPDPPVTPDGVIVGSIWGDVLETFKAQFAEERVALQKRCDRLDADVEVREVVLSASLAPYAAVTQARHTDLSIMLRPRGPLLAEVRLAVFESVLFGSGRPVLLVPPDWKGASLGRRIVIAWSGKREAARAIADALPLLCEADKVFVLIADAKPNSGDLGAEPGADIATHLARHGLNVEVRRVQAPDGDEALALIQAARDVDADLIVMGAFGHSRLGELVFGGVTRSMVKMCPLPVFMSH